MQLSLLEKVARTFAFAFLGIFIPALAGLVSDLAGTRDWNAARAALVSLCFAASAAGLRAIVAFLPVFKDDDHIGIAKKT